MSVDVKRVWDSLSGAIRERFGIQLKTKIEPTGRIIDFTRPTWGHNLELIGSSFDEAEVWVWVTPYPNIGDRVKWAVEHGWVTGMVTEKQRAQGVQDMFKLTLTDIERIPYR